MEKKQKEGNNKGKKLTEGEKTERREKTKKEKNRKGKNKVEKQKEGKKTEGKEKTERREKTEGRKAERREKQTERKNTQGKGIKQKSAAGKSRFNRAMNSLPARTTSYAEYSGRFEKTSRWAKDPDDACSEARKAVLFFNLRVGALRLRYCLLREKHIARLPTADLEV